jgi:ribosomal protein L37E
MGSGSWYRWNRKDTVEDYRAIDVRRWEREGNLDPGCWFSCQWTYARGGTSTISVRVESEWSLRLIYRTRSRGEDEWYDMDYRIGLEHTSCHLGGKRAWFQCPGRGCARRVAKLHQVGRHFVCRHCGNLAYESQREDTSSRAISKAQNIRRKLGASANLIEPFPAKPKGMHWRTYERLRFEGMSREYRSMMLTGEKLGLFDNRLAALERGILTPAA